jgi:hypothetical protein
LFTVEHVDTHGFIFFIVENFFNGIVLDVTHVFVMMADTTGQN